MVENYIASFIGFMPTDYPKVITHYGGTISTPIAKNILLSIIDNFNLSKTNTETT